MTRDSYCRRRWHVVPKHGPVFFGNISLTNNKNKINDVHKSVRRAATYLWNRPGKKVLFSKVSLRIVATLAKPSNDFGRPIKILSEREPQCHFVKKTVCVTAATYQTLVIPVAASFFSSVRRSCYSRGACLATSFARSVLYFF